MEWLTSRLSSLTDKGGQSGTLEGYDDKLENKSGITTIDDSSNSKSKKMKIVTDEPSLEGALDFDKYN